MNAPLKLLWKLVTINSMAIIIVILTIGLAVHLLAADYFATLTETYGIAPGDAHAMFLQAIDRYLLLASLTGFAVASMMSLWLNYRLTRPVTNIQRAAVLVADGDYSQRITVRGCGEIDQLSTAFNRMAERLQQIDRLRKDFIVDVAHELRTPLTNIRGFVEGLRDDVIAPDKAVFESVHEETLRLVHLVEELLQLARADVAHQDLQKEAFNLSLLIQQTLQAFQPRLQEKSLQVTTNLAPDLNVAADRQRIARVLNNVMENALRYSPASGKVSVSCDLSGPMLKTIVTNDVDGGPVQTDTITDALFERFQRGESSRSRQYGGAGLGLAIVRQLVEAHGGRAGIRMVSGQAEVWFELPCS